MFGDIVGYEVIRGRVFPLFAALVGLLASLSGCGPEATPTPVAISTPAAPTATSSIFIAPTRMASIGTVGPTTIIAPTPPSEKKPSPVVQSNTATAAAGDGETHRTLFTIPAGEGGVHYEGLDVTEAEKSGPAAFIAAPDGSFWIADSFAQRLLHYSHRGEQLGIITLNDQKRALMDVEATGTDLLVLDAFPEPPEILRLATGASSEPDGSVKAKYRLPKGLWLEDGLTGITLDDAGELLVELRGVQLFRLVGPDDNLTASPAQGYSHAGKTYSVEVADEVGQAGEPSDPSAPTPHWYVRAGDTRIEITKQYPLGGIRILGFGPDRSFYVTVDEVDLGGTVQVDQSVRHYTDSGEMLGVARVPLAQELTHMQQALTVGPDGTVYHMLTLREGAQIQSLSFAPSLRPILTPPATPTR